MHPQLPRPAQQPRRVPRPVEPVRPQPTLHAADDFPVLQHPDCGLCSPMARRSTRLALTRQSGRASKGFRPSWSLRTFANIRVGRSRLRPRNPRRLTPAQALTGQKRRWKLTMDYERIVAVGLSTGNEVALLGPTCDRLWPVEDAPHFHGCSRPSTKPRCGRVRR